MGIDPEGAGALEGVFAGLADPLTPVVLVVIAVPVPVGLLGGEGNGNSQGKGGEKDVTALEHGSLTCTGSMG
jgi:hypothetical protein